MYINTQNTKKIDAYIRDFPQCKLDYPERVRIQDVMTNITSYRLPLDLLFYNVENGRFASEYLALKKQLKRSLKPEDLNDIKEIEKMLRNQSSAKTEWLKNNLKEFGQEEPGIITHDGYVINGNRRMSVLKLLASEDPKYNYMNVGRLPENVTESDIYKIELGKQMAREQKLDYGPINELLKIQHGLDSGLNVEQIASTIGFTKEEIEEKIDRLELIKEYLEFIKQPENFKEAENKDNHFINLQEQLFSKSRKKKNEFSPLELFNIKEIAFSTIQSGISHMELRKIPKLVKNERIKPIFMEATQYVTSEPEKTMKIFDVCTTRLKAEDDRDKPDNLLNAILGNFEALGLPNDELKKEEYKTMIRKVISFLDELKKLA